VRRARTSARTEASVAVIVADAGVKLRRFVLLDGFKPTSYFAVGIK
jgi:hypothetical protein